MAEEVAFCMWVEAGVGLTATPDQVKAAMRNRRLSSDDEVASALDALNHTRIGRYDESMGVDHNDEKVFLFSHCRFQEYFATCMVIRNPELVTTTELLTDGRWRETAVAMCQMHRQLHLVVPLMEEAASLLKQHGEVMTAGLDLDPETDPTEAQPRP